MIEKLRSAAADAADLEEKIKECKEHGGESELANTMLDQASAQAANARQQLEQLLQLAFAVTEDPEEEQAVGGKK